MDATGMDPRTAVLAIQLQVAEIDQLLDGLYDEDELPDGDSRTAFETMRRDLAKQLQILDGQVLTLKILREEHENRNTFMKLLQKEKQAKADHEITVSLAELGPDSAQPEPCNDDNESLFCVSDCGEDPQWNMGKEIYATAFERVAEWSISQEDTNKRPALERTFGGAGVRKKSTLKPSILGSETLTKCIACMEVVATENTLTLARQPVAHVYCRTCLIDLFKSAITETTLFPPRCCKVPIPIETCRIRLPKELVKQFDLMTEELATPNPTYCADADCAQFIRPKNIKADVARCASCRNKTCAKCKSIQRKDLCPSDPHVQLLLDSAK